MAKAKVLIITGYGVNCEAESSHAWAMAGAEPHLLHLNDLLENPDSLNKYDALMFIGGFSYGDHMSSGHVFARRVGHHLKHELEEFVSAEKLIMGVCNGFQVMTKLGLLPALDGTLFEPSVALLQNDCGHFQNYWVELAYEQSSPCVFTRGLSRMPLPIRHGEGKFYAHDSGILNRIEELNCVACRYADPDSGAPTMEFPANPNGSQNSIAGICDPSGRIFGMMPHPEAYLFPENHPNWDTQKLNGTLPEQGLGDLLFKNAVSYIEGH